jgi:uncharacterized membrane protein YhaH (DUF805 family)
MEMMIAPLKKYADFQGRARRAEYWMFVLFQILVYIAVAILGMIVSGGNSNSAAATGLMALVTLGLLLPSIAVTVRRLHDTNRTGWWILISFLPLIGGIWLLVLTVLDGTPANNRFGPDPKGRGDSDTSGIFD